jgi:hypothetical protein
LLRIGDASVLKLKRSGWGEKKKWREWLTPAVSLQMGFILGCYKLSDYGVFTNRQFTAAFFGSMARKCIHFTETAAAPSELFILHKNPETCDKNSLMSIAGILDAFDVVDGIFPRWTIR